MSSPQRPIFLLKAVLAFAALHIGIVSSFAAASADIDQAENGTPASPISPVDWVNGNVNSSKAHYVEGYSVAYRIVVTGVSTGAHNLKFEWDIRNSGKAGIDYITHFNRLQPHNQFPGGHTTAEVINPIIGIAGIFLTNTFPIPAPSSAGSQTPGQPTASFNALPAGERLMTIYNGTISNLTYVFEGGLTNNNSSTQISVDFFASNSTVVIAWGGHIASKQDWGAGNSANSISGSPYHTRVIELDGSGGNQDRALAAAAVVSPPFCLVSGPGSVCPLTTNSYLVTTDSTNVTFAWFLTNNTAGATIVGASTNQLVQVAAGTNGAYQINVTITTAGGIVNSTCGQFVMIATNTASTPLTNIAACQGGQATFVTTPSGTGPFTFVWRKNGTLISGATTNSLSFTNLTFADTATYAVEVTGFCRSATNSATLTVNTNTAATALTNATKCTGESFALSTTVSGTGPFTFVWRKDGTAIPGATSNSFSIPSITTNDAGTYCVEVTGACNSVTNCANLIVNLGTMITALVNSTNCPGSTAIFSTTASGAGPFTYVWKKDNVVIPGETNSSLTISPVTSTNGGTYTVEVTGTCNTASSSALLVVQSDISITSLVSVSACLGETVVFSTIASGSGPFTYLWRFEGNPIAGATTNSLTISPVTATNAGTYSVEVTGACGTTNSTATLTLNTNTSATELTSLTLCPGETATFSTVASGTGPFSYQWTKDSAILNGETNSSLVISNVSSLDAATYCVEVTGDCNSVTNCATLTVKTNTSATELTSLTLCPGETATFSTVASGTGPFSYQWTKANVALTGETNSSLVISNVSSLDAATYCVEVTGNCTSVTNCATLTVKTNTSATELTSLTLCPGETATFSTMASGTGPFSYQWTKGNAALNGETNSSLVISNVSSLDAATYCVEVTGDCNSVTNCATLTVKTNTSATELTSLTLCPGETATFSTVASGTGPFSYQWTKDSAVLNGETNSSLVISNVSSLDAATYCVEVTGNCTSVTNCATLTVKTNTSATELTSLTLCPGETATFSTVASGTGPFSYQWTKANVALTGETNSSLVISNVSSLDAATYCVEVTGNCTSVTNCATLTVKTNTSATELTSLTLCPGETATFSTVASGTGPFTYQWTKDSAALTGETNSSLVISNVSSLDAATYCVEVTGDCNSVTNCATLTVKTNTSATELTSLTLCPGETATFSTVASGTGPFSYQWTKGNAALTGETNSSLVISNVSSLDAATYCVEVTGNCTSVTNCATLTVKTNTSATELTSLTLCPGETATFSTVASGTGPFTYQWTKASVALTGETNNSLVISNVSSLDAATYCVEVTGNCTSVTNCATLTVKTNTSTTELTSLTLCPGETATFSTVASGTGPFSYQWTKANVALTGETNSSLVISNVSSLDAATYCVEVTGNCTSVTNCATLTVKTNTSATELTSLALCPGETATFSTVASGTGPFSYQWTKASVALTGETNSSLVISNVSSLDAATYCVEVTGNCTSVTNCATLTVKTNTSATELTSLTLCPGETATFSTVASGTGPFSYQWTKASVALTGETNSSLVISNVSSLDAATYCVEVTGNCTSVTNCATLTVKTNTSATELTSLTLCPGETATFSTVASGTGPFTYQWTKASVILAGETNSSLVISNVSSLDAATYCVEVTGNCTSVTNCATLTVKTNTSTTELTSLTLCPGETASFSTVASGTGPFSYQWTKANVALTGETNSSLVISNVSSLDAAIYCVEVTGNCTSVTNCATLTVKTNTSATELASLTLCPGETATFSTVASGTGPFTYQWTRDNAVLNGETNSSLVISNVSSLNAATYCVEVTGNCTSVTNCATLTVKTNTSATELTSLTLCPGETATFNTVASGTGPFTYQWTKDNAVLSGQTNNSLVISNVTSIHSGQYCVQVTGNCTSVTNCATLTVKTNTSATELTSLTLCPGETATFITVASGTGPFSYQWTKGNAVLTGETNNSLVITNVSSLDAATYCVKVTGNCTSVTNCATLTVKTNTSATELISLTLCPGDTATFSTVASGTGPFTYQWTKDNGVLSSQTNSSLVISNVTSINAGQYCVQVTGNCTSVTNCATLTVKTNTSATALANLTLCPGETALFSTVASGTGPFSYQWTKASVALTGETNSSLVISNVSSLDAATYCLEVTGNCTSVTNCATLTVKTNTSATELTSLTLCPGETATFSTVASGTGPFTYQWTKDNGVLNDQTNSSLVISNVTSINAGQYCVQVTGNCTSVTNCATLTVKTNTSATALASLTLCPGETAVFSTVASGTGPFTYQWTKDNGVLSSQTNSSLVISNVTSINAGQYCVQVTGNCTSVTNCATLTVKTNTSATALANLTLCPGETAVFSTVASGTGPFTYQWTKDNGVLSGQTNSSLVISNVTSINAGQYCVQVTGNCTSVTNCATLTVKTNTSATALANLTLCPGETAVFSTVASGTGPFTYQWTKDNGVLSSQTNSSLVISNVTSINAGQYCVQVTGNCTSVTNCATLTVKTNTSATALANLTLCPGETAVFSTVASGTGPFTYQWTKDNGVLSSQTNSSLVISNVTSINAGQYCVQVTGNCTSVTNCATLTVKTNTSATALANLTLCPGETAVFSTVASGTGPFTYQWTKDNGVLSAQTNSSLVISNVTSINAGQYCVQVTGNCTSVTNCATLTVKTNTSATALANLTLCPGETAVFSTVASGTGPFTYQWTKDNGVLNGQTNSSLVISNVTSINAGQYCVQVTGNCTSVTNCATLTVKTNTSATALASLTLCPGETAVFSTVASGTGPFTYQWTKDNGVLSAQTNSSLVISNVTSINAGQYCVKVTGNCTSVTNCATLTVRTNTSATALANLAKCPGESATFSTVPSGTGPFTYQWSKNGTNISSATSNSFSIPVVAPADAGVYCVVVTGFCNSVTNCGMLQVLTPKIAVVKVCPANPTPPGGVLTFSGIVSNAGNVTLTNVTVVVNQPTNNTPVLGPIMLAPGQTSPFTGSYTTPSESCGGWVDTVTARANASCTGSNVLASTTTVCPSTTTPGVIVTASCPPNPVPLGQPLIISGTVSNTGNVTLTNVVVVINQPTNNTPVFGPVTLARGESANFTASYVPGIDSCLPTSSAMLTARGNSGCTGSLVTSSIATVCPVVTVPRLALVKFCPTNPVAPGGIFTFSGIVSNAGNVTLTNVFVTNDKPTNNTPVIGPITLAPGASTNFSGSYKLCPTCCGPYVDTLTAVGVDRCTGNAVSTTATASCPGSTTPLITVTKHCPATPAVLGDPLIFSGVVSNAGNVVLNNVQLSDNQAGYIGQIQALAPGEAISYVAGYVPGDCGTNFTSTVMAIGTDACRGILVTNTATANCAVICAVGQPVTLINPHIAGGNMVFSFLSETGHTYRVEFTASLSVISWQFLTNVPGNGGIVVIQDPMTQTQRFYRVLTQ